MKFSTFAISYVWKMNHAKWIGIGLSMGHLTVHLHVCCLIKFLFQRTYQEQTQSIYACANPQIAPDICISLKLQILWLILLLKYPKISQLMLNFVIWADEIIHHECCMELNSRPILILLPLCLLYSPIS